MHAFPFGPGRQQSVIDRCIDPQRSFATVMWHIFIYCLSLIQPSHRWQYRLSFKTDIVPIVRKWKSAVFDMLRMPSGKAVMGLPAGTVTNIINQLSSHSFILLVTLFQLLFTFKIYISFFFPFHFFKAKTIIATLNNKLDC